MANHGSSVIFSDETKIMLGNNYKIYFWRKADGRLRSECLGVCGDRKTTCSASLKIVRCILCIFWLRVNPIVLIVMGMWIKYKLEYNV